MTRVSVPEKGVESLFGTHDENLRLLEQAFKVRIRGHGSELTIEGETQVLMAGCVGVIPGGAMHSGRALTDCRIIDAFHPVREDYRQQDSG